MSPSGSIIKQGETRSLTTTDGKGPSLSSCIKEARLFFSIMMAIVAVIIVVTYNIATSIQSSSTVFMPLDWSKGFGSDVKWEFDHGIEHVQTKRPLVIAHRGHSGAMPEETLEAYSLAVSAGADIIECDACLTKDLKVVCAHESWINKTTNVAEVFPNRSSQYFMSDTNGGRMIDDFFTFDFDLEELKMLTKVEPRPYRDQNNNKFCKIATLEEMIEIAKNAPHPVGIHVEIKDSGFINNVSKITHGKKFEDIVIEDLHKKGYTKKTSPCFIQSFDEGSLKYISSITSLPLVLLIEFPGNVSEEYLEEVARYAYGIGPDKRHLALVNATTRLVESHSNLVSISQRLGLKLHVYTFRNERDFLAWNYRQDPYNEYADFFRLGIDGYFTDFPDTFKNFLDVIYARRSESSNSPSRPSFQMLCLLLAMLNAIHALL